MESFFSDTVKVILLGVLAIAFALNWLARSRPEVAWLQVFRLPALHLSEEQKARRRRTANRITGLEIIVGGLALPLLYILATVMMFNNFETVPTVIVGACSVLCIALGIWIFWRNR